MIKLNRRKYNEEFKDTDLKCSYVLDVYFDIDKCKIIFKIKMWYKIFITILFPIFTIIQISLHGIFSLKEFYIDYFGFIKDGIYKSRWIHSKESWIYVSMCKILGYDILGGDK